MRKILVTGGAGFIGSHIVEALVRRGDQVRVLDNLNTGKLANLVEFGKRVEFIEGDVADPAAAARAVAGVECIFHEAALASVPRSLERPLDTHAACATGTLVLLDQAARAGVRRLVYAGSSSAYGDQPTSSKRETDLPLPISPYGAAKVAAEFYCQAYAAMGRIETVTLRYFNVFGPRQDPNGEYSAVIPKFITLLLSGQRPRIFGDGGQSRDFTFVGDVVAGNLLAADAARCLGPSVEHGRRPEHHAAGNGGRLESPAGNKGRTGIRAAASRRYPRKPGRYHASPAIARLRTERQLRRRAPPVDRLLSIGDRPMSSRSLWHEQRRLRVRRSPSPLTGEGGVRVMNND